MVLEPLIMGEEEAIELSKLMSSMSPEDWRDGAGGTVVVFDDWRRNWTY